MAFVLTGFSLLDSPHRDLERCIRDLAVALRLRDAAEARGWMCLLHEKLAEHFVEEEALMRAREWSQLAMHAEAHANLLLQVHRFERRIAVLGLTHEVASWGLTHLPEHIRHHCIASDFGFAMFALGLAQDPGRPGAPAQESPYPTRRSGGGVADTLSRCGRTTGPRPGGAGARQRPSSQSSWSRLLR